MNRFQRFETRSFALLYLTENSCFLLKYACIMHMDYECILYEFIDANIYVFYDYYLLNTAVHQSAVMRKMAPKCIRVCQRMRVDNWVWAMGWVSRCLNSYFHSITKFTHISTTNIMFFIFQIYWFIDYLWTDLVVHLVYQRKIGKSNH